MLSGGPLKSEEPDANVQAETSCILHPSITWDPSWTLIHFFLSQDETSIKSHGFLPFNHEIYSVSIILNRHLGHFFPSFQNVPGGEAMKGQETFPYVQVIGAFVC